MSALETVLRRTPRWLQAGAFKRSFELVDASAGDGAPAAATLVFRSAMGSLADARTEDGHWTFKRVGFWKPRVTVRRAGGEADVAVFEPDWGTGGVLRFADGRTLRWRSLSFWSLEFGFGNDTGETWLRFKPRMGLRISADVEVVPEGRSHEDLALLVLLGFYLMVLLFEDTVVVTSAG